MPADRIVVLGTHHAAPTLAVCNYLVERFPGCKIVYERRESRKDLLRRRVKKLGLLTVAGQIAFRTIIVPILEKSSARRIEQIKSEFALRSAPVVGPVFSSVNSQQAIEAVKAMYPACVVVAGTRIISKDFLRNFRCPIVNIHAGITPLYRGVHGAYWALVEQRPELCGVTVHYVDAGIDTGQILAQERVQPQPVDNFVTYPWLQLGVGLRLLVKLLPDIIQGRAATVEALTADSKLRTHPTMWGYYWGRVRRGVK
jgi:folate-dependent phosphoribosylglycinamide formyltransferase PurN